MAKACLENMFNNHIYCDSQWCLAKKAKEEGKAYTHPVDWLSCSDDPVPKVYHQLNQIIEQYGSAFYLRQSMHNFTTQTNEALNNSQAVVTSKAKVLIESRSFHYRHAIVIGTHNWGTRKFWNNVFSQLSIATS